MTIKIADILYHARKKPIDHPESSILFAHLSKELKEELLRLALSTLMNRALLNAETKDFYIILADVRTPSYPNGYYGTIMGYGARTPITITEQSGNDLTDYAVKIELDDAWDGWDAVIDGNDIYFLDENGNPLYFWIEKFDKQNKHAVIWVKIPLLPANSSITIYMHYGGGNPYSAYHDPNQVFLFFDDFEDGVLDWNVGTALSSATEENGYVELIAKANTWNQLEPSYQLSKQVLLTLDKPFIIEAEIEWIGQSGDLAQIFVELYQDTTLKLRFGVLDAWSSSNPAIQMTTPSGTSYSSGENTLPGTGRSVFKVVYDGSRYALYVDDVQKTSIADVEVGDVNYIVLTNTRYQTNNGKTARYYYVLIRPYAEPEPSIDIGASEFAEVETANLQFPDGIDKILVTIDSDAQEAYFSTDGGQTWNALTLDEEILLPETAYQLKLKFSNMTYFRGYALVGW